MRLESLEDRTLLSAPVSTNDELATAINTANRSGGATTITLASGTTFDFTSADNSTNGVNALPVISGNITILGNGDIIERTGSTAFRLFDVASGGSLTVQNMTLQGGLAFGTGVAAEGGAIYSSGTLNLSGVTVQSNEAQGSNGANGGQGASGSNGANAFGGGLYVAGGTVSLSNDSLNGNSALGGKGGKGGGGGDSYGAGGSGGNGGAGSGGALYVAGGAVTLSNDTLSNNSAQGSYGGNGGSAREDRAGSGGSGGAGSGGALYVAGGTVTLNNNTLSSNSARGSQGGNGASPGGAGGNGGSGGASIGGGLCVDGGIATLNDDTLSSNSAAEGGAGGEGGAGSFVGGSGGNGGASSGGGLYVAQGAVTLNNDTLSSNSAAEGGKGGKGGFGFERSGSGGSGGNSMGGGLFVASGSAAFLGNTLIAENTIAAAGTGGTEDSGGITGAPGSTGISSGPDVSGTVRFSDHDLIGDTSGSSGFSTANGDILNPSSVRLGPLANNGGPTQTMALLPGSPAIDAGDSHASGLPSTDQRGYARISGNAVDIGAIEYQFDLAVSGSAPSSVQQGQAINYQITVPPLGGPVGTLTPFAVGLGPTGIDLFEIDSQGEVFAQGLFGGGLQLIDTSLELPLALMSEDALLARLAAENGQSYVIDIFNLWLPLVELAVFEALHL